MAQFDLYRNPNPHGRAAAPFVVSLQSDMLERLPSRWVAPLKPSKSIAKRVESLMPEIEFEGKAFTIFMYESGAVPAALLGEKIGSLGPHRHAIIRAIDVLVAGV